LVLIASVVVAGAMATVARGAYWDFSGYLSQNYTYWESTSQATNFEIRLSRQYCGTKMQIWLSGGGIWRVPIPGGCATSDYTYVFRESAAECINIDGPTMWVNCRVAPTP
jgi:hypothetical protein